MDHSNKSEKLKKIKLSGKTENLDNSVIGISSDQKIHKLAWEINESTYISLSKSNDYIVDLQKDISFSVFSYKEDEQYFFLIENKTEGFTLSSKYSNLDYILIIPNFKHEDDDFIKSFLKKIRKNSTILGAYIIDSCQTIDNAVKIISADLQ